jgi:hypothetical protein
MITDLSAGLLGLIYPQHQFGILNRFLIENVSAGDHCFKLTSGLFRCRTFRWGRPSKGDTWEAQKRGRGKAGARAADYVRR